MSTVEYCSEKNTQYPILDMEGTPGFTTDILNMECAKHADDQYEPFVNAGGRELGQKNVNKLPSMLVIFPSGQGLEHGTVIGRKCDQDGHPVGHGSATPLLNSRVYKVEGQVRYIHKYHANTIAEIF